MKRQHGAVLIIMMVILILGVTAILFHSLTSTRIKTEQRTNTARALKQAKEALIGFAVTYAENHAPAVDGYLPCPDINGSNGEGSSPLGSCGMKDVNQLGRLPWRTLRLSDFRDGHGECLWYAVSGTYKDNPKTGLMNWDTSGQLQTYATDNSQLSNDVVAVILSPGVTLSGQNRSGSSAPICGGNYTASNYLDNDTVHGINNTDIATGIFIQGTDGSDTNNDQMIFITRQEIWAAIQKRTDFQSTLNNLTLQVAQCLAHYGKSNSSYACDPSAGCYDFSLPWPALVSLKDSLNHPELDDYSLNTDYKDYANIYAGRVPYDVNISVNAGGVLHNPLNPLMTTASCSATGWDANVDAWWNNWKDQLFYALGAAFRPTWGSGQSCGFGYACLKINSSLSPRYAGVVMFANKGLSGQIRASATTCTGDPTTPSCTKTIAPRWSISNYLESNNASNFPIAIGKEDYTTAPTSSSFNDILYCIDASMNVAPCP